MKKRYNACLVDIGITPTELDTFHIDGWGWSPEIATERDDRFYLSHGMANPFGIIISPDQKKCPIYMPYHTFDWDIHHQIFDNYEEQIADITSGNGIWFEIDQNISAYRNADDLLMVEVVNVRFNVTGDVQEAAQHQKELVTEYNSGNAWLNAELREKIIASSKLFGDLRYRNLQLPEMPFAHVSSYYTLAFGGLFLFKGTPDKPILILEDDSSEISGNTDQLHIEFNLSDRSFIPYLYNQRFLNSDPSYFVEQLWLLEIQLEHMIVAGAMEMDSETAVDRLTTTQRKGLVNQLNKAKLLNPDYFELEALVNKIKGSGGEGLKVPAQLNDNLLHPHVDTTLEQARVLWQLIAKLQNNNPVLLYTFDKAAFYAVYQTWSAPMQRWAINAIQSNRHVYSRLTNT